MKRRPQQGFGKHDRTLDRSPQNRRLDSIARLLNTKDEVCTAVCFNQGRILLANNNARLTELQTQYISFFRDCLVGGPEYLKKPEFHRKHQALLAASIAETERPGKHLANTIATIEDLQKQPLTTERKAILQEIKADFTNMGNVRLATLVSDYLKDQKTDLSSLHQFYQSKLAHDRELAHERLSIDIDKVVHALTSNEANAFTHDIKAAFLQPFLFVGQDTPKLHAEMKILDYLYITGQLDLGTTQTNSDVEPIYLGISKLCCLECSATVKALNEQIKELFEAEQMEVSDLPSAEAAATTTPRQHHATTTPVTPPRKMSGATKLQESPIKTRGFHLGSFPGWQPPEFLHLIHERHAQAMLELSKDIKTKHLPGFSPSPAAKIQPISTDSDDEHKPKKHLPPPPALLMFDDEEIAATARPTRSVPKQTVETPKSKAVLTDAPRIEIWDRKTYMSKSFSTPKAKAFGTPATTPHKLATRFQDSPQTLPRRGAAQNLGSLQHRNIRKELLEAGPLAATPAPKGKASSGKRVPQGMTSREEFFTEQEQKKYTPTAKPAPKVSPPGKHSHHTKQSEEDLFAAPKPIQRTPAGKPLPKAAPPGKRATTGMQSRERSFVEQELAKKPAAATSASKIPGSELAPTKSRKHVKNHGMQSREVSFAEQELSKQPPAAAVKKPAPKGKGGWITVVSKKNAKGQRK